MSRAENKSSRLLEIEALLLAYPEGMSQAEISRKLGVNRSTILRNLADVPNVNQGDDGLLRIDRAAYLVNLRLNLNEALALHLATRLLATRMDRQNPHAAAALRKLGLALELLAPCLSRHIQQSADAMDDPTQRQDPNYLRTLETLTLAWADLRKVRVWHRRDDGGISETVFSPYFIEPYAVGQAVHTIGWREPPGALRTLKLDRIERIERLPTPYEIPPDFCPAELFKDAWGIWYTGEAPVEVVLKFSPQVARRVRETRWHRSEQVTALEDGSLLWKAMIAEPIEMLNWIRGWGADVEVLEPERVRRMMVNEVQRLTQLYNEGGNER
jgi:CRISPR-associated endonuclease/helicase Cas3